MEKTRKQLIVLAVFVFVISPICAWTSVIASDETAVYASLSRMIWYSGDALRILIAMLVMFLPMLVAFFLSHKLIGLSQAEKYSLINRRNTLRTSERSKDFLRRKKT